MKYQIIKQKNSLSVVALVFSLLFCTTIYAQDAKVGKLTFQTEVIDYGEIVQNADGERIFKFTNTGDAPVVISKVKTTCGCTVPEYPKTAILPGDSGEIKIKYATSRIGAFTKGITVFSNASNKSQTLKIKGEVLKGPL
ncbi:DUF1573 domain-containing protein [Algibacter sp. 2305UL17-15]|uniref:DUF1573 domain-containing protein n=1 Tax=Algibacter sp. 2305UL17-15 TaxID=3231268 RepID=UPI00345B4192